MKKASMLLYCVFAIGILNAQYNNAQYFKWGATANFHKGSIVGVHDYSTGKYGVGAGFFADIALTENDVYDSSWMFLEPQIEFSTQGEIAKAEEEKFGLQKYYANYVAAMLYLKWFYHMGNMKRDVFLFAGPRVEYMVSHSKEVDPAYDAAYYQYNLDSNMAKFGYGVSFGSGIRLDKQWEAFIRYDRGFSKVYTDNPKNTYNRLIAVGLNFYINTNWR